MSYFRILGGMGQDVAVISQVVVATLVFLVTTTLVVGAWIYSVVAMSDPGGFVVALLVTGLFSFGVVRISPAVGAAAVGP